MERDEVGLLQEEIEVDHLDTEPLGVLDGDKGIVGQDLHVEAPGSARHLRADFAKTDDPQDLVADLGADEL